MNEKPFRPCAADVNENGRQRHRKNKRSDPYAEKRDQFPSPDTQRCSSGGEAWLVYCAISLRGTWPSQRARLVSGALLVGLGRGIVALLVDLVLDGVAGALDAAAVVSIV